MPDRAETRWPWRLIVRRSRLVSGLILFAFVATHLLNHALGLVSLDAMDAVRDWRVAATRSLPGTAILASAAVVHLLLGLARFWQRRTWSMSEREAIQLVFGLLIPLLLLRHLIGMRFSHELFGVDDDYLHALFVLWPTEAWRQLLLIALVWVHGCIGLYVWLRLKPGYRRFQPVLFALAVLVPVLAYAGFAVAGREVRVLYQYTSPLSDQQYQTIVGLMNGAVMVYLALLSGLVMVRLLVMAIARFRARLTVRYADGPVVTAAAGQTLLEISRANGIPHAAICGGRGRCSTCRVRLIDGFEDQPEPDPLEAGVLDRIGAMGHVRLACQLRPAAALTVQPLLPARRFTARDLATLDKYFWGVERNVTLVFADIRGFTRLSEGRLPYDVVFLLNQYLARMSEAIEDAGGYVDKFMGDGIMAIFGMAVGPQQAALSALAAARAMGGVVEALNQSLRHELAEPLRIGIGIHSGDAILGRIGVQSGSGAGERVTALGDTVNAASRLEAATKELGVQLLVSEATLAAAGLSGQAGAMKQIRLRGRRKALRAAAIGQAVDVHLPE